MPVAFAQCAALVALVAGFSGLGVLASATLGAVTRTQAPAPRLAACAALGCAAFMFATGLANLVGVYSLELALALVIGGLLVWAHRIRTVAPAAWLHGSWARAAAAGGLVLVVFVLALIPPEINQVDDGTGYLVFARKLLTLGSTGPEPFSERRMYTFGGQLGIVAMLLGIGGDRWLSLHDPGLGVALMLLSALGTGVPVRRRWAGAWILALASVLTAAFVIKPIANTAPVYLISGLFFAALGPLCIPPAGEPERAPGLSDSAGNGALLASCIAIRPTALPMLCLWAAVHVVGLLRARCFRAAGGLVLTGIIVIVPFMALMLRASGTLLYPVLGRGTHSSAYAPQAAYEAGGLDSLAGPVLGGALTDPSAIACALLGLAVAIAVPTRRRTAALLVVSVALSTLALYMLTGGLAAHRYAFPTNFGVFGVLLLLLPLERVLDGITRSLPAGRARWTALAVSAVLAAAMAVAIVPRFANHAQDKIATRLASIDPAGAVLASYAAAQACTRPGEAILAVEMSHTAKLDLRRNPIVVHDQSGAAGPAPGWHAVVAQGSVPAYLRDQGIGYLMTRSSPPQPVTGLSNRWAQQMVDYQQLFWRGMKQVEAHGRVCYRDERLQVIDIRSPDSPAIAPSH